MDTNNDITKMMKLISLQCLCEIIPNHVQSGTEFHRCLLLRDHISNIMVYNIDVSCTLATWSSIIIFQFDGTLAILIDNIVVDLLSLIFQEVPGPDQLGQKIFHSNKINLSWSLCVQFLFSRLYICPLCSYIHTTTSVYPNTILHHKWCIKIPLYIDRLVYWQYQW